MRENLIIKLSRIPESWQLKTIGSIATVVRGASPRPQGDPRYYGGKVPRLMGKDVTRDGKYVTPAVDFLTEEGALRSRFMKAGTLVMVCSGNVGVPSILAVDACVHDGFLAFPEISEECSKEYLYYIFDSLYQEFNSSATHGGVFTNLTTTIIKEFNIAIPPLSEQEKIAAILSLVDEKIEVIDAQISQTQELKKGLMQQLLTKGIGHTKFKISPLGEIPESWEVVKFGDVATINPAKELNIDGEECVSFIAMADVSESAKIITHHEKKFKEVSKGFTSFIDGDVLLAKITPCFENGKGALVNNLINGKGFGSTEFHVIRSTNKILNKFIYYHTISFSFRENGRINMTGSAGQKRVQKEFISRYAIGLPSIQEQQKIAFILITFDEKLEVLHDKKTKYKEMKKSLMQQLLTGKIRVNQNLST